jgi:hypothetical protein
MEWAPVPCTRTSSRCCLAVSLGFLVQLAPVPGGRHPLPGAHPQQGDLELGQGGEDVEEHLAHRVERVVDRSAERQPYVAGHEGVTDGARVGDGVGEPVQLRHDEGQDWRSPAQCPWRVPVADTGAWLCRLRTSFSQMCGWAVGQEYAPLDVGASVGGAYSW